MQSTRAWPVRCSALPSLLLPFSAGTFLPQVHGRFEAMESFHSSATLSELGTSSNKEAHLLWNLWEAFVTEQ